VRFYYYYYYYIIIIFYYDLMMLNKMLKLMLNRPPPPRMPPTTTHPPRNFSFSVLKLTDRIRLLPPIDPQVGDELFCPIRKPPKISFVLL
jgi:hypothetical protein